MLNALSNLREAAHALVAILGVLAVSGSAVVGVLAAFGVHGFDLQVAQFTGAAGAGAVLLSKLIDSANDAIVAHAPSSIGSGVGGTISGEPPVA